MRVGGDVNELMGVSLKKEGEPHNREWTNGRKNWKKTEMGGGLRQMKEKRGFLLIKQNIMRSCF